MSISIVHGDDGALPVDAIDGLRRAAWSEIMGDDATTRFGIDRFDGDSWHYLTHDGDDLVAAGRLTLCDVDSMPEEASFGPYRGLMVQPLGFAGRLVVHRGYRGRGLAAAILASRITHAHSLGLRQVWGETRTTDVDGLQRHGYELVGPSADTSVPGDWSILCAPIGHRA